MIICKQFTFHAAHYIPNHPTCGRMHGHTYRLDIEVNGPIRGVDAREHQEGMVLDFGILKRIVQIHVLDELDHGTLNLLPGLDIPTAENLCTWIWMRLVEQVKAEGVHLVFVRVWETPTAYAEICYSDVMRAARFGDGP